MKVRTNLKAGLVGRISTNHNETLVRDEAGVTVKTGLKAGGPETTPSRRNQRGFGSEMSYGGLRVRTNLKAGPLHFS